MAFSIPPIQGIDLAGIDRAVTQNKLAAYAMKTQERQDAMETEKQNALRTMLEGLPTDQRLLATIAPDEFVKTRSDPSYGHKVVGNALYDLRGGAAKRVAGGYTLDDGTPFGAGAGAPQPPASRGAYSAQVASAESGGNPTARNPNSSATGAGQFIDSTWLGVIKRHAPEVATGKQDAELLAMRSDPNLSARMIDAYAADNTPVLSRALGRAPTSSELYMAHFLGGDGAAKFLTADQAAPAARFASPAAVSANRSIFFDADRARTVGEVTRMVGGKVGGGGGKDAPAAGVRYVMDENGKPVSAGDGLVLAVDAQGRQIAAPMRGAGVSQLSAQEVQGLGLPAGTVAQRAANGQLSILSKPETLTTDMREYGQAVKDGSFKGGFADYLAAMKKAGKSETNVTVGGDNALQKAMGEKMASNVFAARDVADSAIGQLSALDEAKKLLQSGIISGSGAGWKLALDKTLSSVGLSSGEKVANTEAFAAGMGRQTLELVKGLGAGSGISNADRDFAEKIAGGAIDLNEQSIRRVIDINERAARRAVERYNASVKPLIEDPQTPASLRGYLPLTVPTPSIPASAPQSPPPVPAQPSAQPPAAPAPSPSAPPSVPALPPGFQILGGP